MKCWTAVVGGLVVTAFAAVNGQHGDEEKYGPPEPYSYSYATEDAEGSSTAEQSTDGSGRVQGKYTLSLADGRTRTVTYWADETGFHADVVTNELGTESKNPADVTIQSSAPTGAEAALAAEPQRVKAKASFVEPVYASAPPAAAYLAPAAAAPVAVAALPGHYASAAGGGHALAHVDGGHYAVGAVHPAYYHHHQQQQPQQPVHARYYKKRA